MEAKQIVDLLTTGGAVAALAVFLYGFKAAWWVPGDSLRREVEAHNATRAELRAEREEVARLNERIANDLLPPLVRVTDMLAANVERRAGGSARGR